MKLIASSINLLLYIALLRYNGIKISVHLRCPPYSPTSNKTALHTLCTRIAAWIIYAARKSMHIIYSVLSVAGGRIYCTAHIQVQAATRCRTGPSGTFPALAGSFKLAPAIWNGWPEK